MLVDFWKDLNSAKNQETLLSLRLSVDYSKDITPAKNQETLLSLRLLVDCC